VVVGLRPADAHNTRTPLPTHSMAPASRKAGPQLSNCWFSFVGARRIGACEGYRSAQLAWDMNTMDTPRIHPGGEDHSARRTSNNSIRIRCVEVPATDSRERMDVRSSFRSNGWQRTRRASLVVSTPRFGLVGIRHGLAELHASLK
jgi:hypothetical protein